MELLIAEASFGGAIGFLLFAGVLAYGAYRMGIQKGRKEK